MSSKPQLAFAGLGAMGGGMAINLAKNSYPINGFDVYTPLVEKFVKEGGSTAKASSTPAEAAKGAEFFIIMVANAMQVSSLLFEGDDAGIKGLGEGKTIILNSTCPPHYLHELREKLDNAGRKDVKLIDAPVSGGTIRAANGTLSIFAAGPEEHLNHAQEVLDCMSGNLYRVEGGISSGTKVKTIHQLLAATNIVLASEANGLAATVGLNTQQVMEFVKENDGTSFMYENRTPHQIADDWSPLSALGIILKDAGIVTEAGRKSQFSMPLANTAEQLYWAGVQKGYLRDDDAKMVQLYLPSNSGSLVAEMAKKESNLRMNSSHQVSKETVNDLLAGVHLAASVEALAFCKHLGMSTKLMYEIISKAAGWNRMFTNHMEAMLEKDEWTLAACKDADTVRDRLSTAVDKAKAIKYPCPMAVVALQQFYFAGLSK